MEIVNFGHFVANSDDGGIIYFRNEDGQDWYDLRFSLTTWTSAGAFINAVYGAWAAVDPTSMRVTNVEFDPSRLMPNNRIILGIDADPADIAVGNLFTGTSFLDVPSEPLAADVDRERDARINGGFIFDSVRYQTRSEDRENIAGAKSAATDAITLGAAEGEYDWQRLIDPDAPAVFQWIAEDNTSHPMDAQTMVRFGYAALAHKQRLIFAARAIKNMSPIPADFATNNDYW